MLRLLPLVLLLCLPTTAFAMGMADPPPGATPPLEVPATPQVPANGGGAPPLDLMLDLPDGRPDSLPLAAGGLWDVDLPDDLGVPPGPPGGVPPILDVPPGPPASMPPFGAAPPVFAAPSSAQAGPFAHAPEPGTSLLVGLGLIGLGAARRRR